MDRNFLLAIVLSLGVLLAWELLVSGPQTRAFREAQRQAAAEQQQPEQQTSGADLSFVKTDKHLSIEEALAAAPGRVPIDTPSLDGSINLAGGRIDDLRLRQYHETLADKSPEIRLLNPENTEHGHYLQLGWLTAGSQVNSPLWTAPEGARLTPTTPVTLTRRDGPLVFETTISIDEKYMFTVSQTVRNEGGDTVSLTPYGAVIQRGIPTGAGKYMILHEGPIAIVKNSLFERKYKKAVTAVEKATGDKGWIGITNKYWLAAAIPPQGETFNMVMRNVGSKEAPVFQTAYDVAPRALGPGETTTLVSHLYGGPKDVDTLQQYEKPVDKGGLGVWDFDRAVDWGNFWFLTRPIFATLNFFGDLTGNFGVAILILTLIIKMLTFPLANRAYDMTSKMKKIQPEMEKLKARYGDDKVKLQQEMMELYKKEKLNPIAGCFPVLLQMPIFYALYKTLFVTIELRHEPFILWIKDLSAPDPTSIFNLFGLIPYDPTSLPVIGAFLGVGVLPLLMGVAMWFQTKLNPPPADPTQAQIFAMMPFIFVFLFSSFASGLVLYWFWNTALSVLQQWIIMKRNGVSVDWAKNLNLPWFRKNSAVSGK
ncbi:MAG: membrane protein insertase YidC [Pseudomonadota bacterium]|nr:membrane protein insertase YidC [Pseudomonadota bacterium]